MCNIEIFHPEKHKVKPFGAVKLLTVGVLTTMLCQTSQ